MSLQPTGPTPLIQVFDMPPALAFYRDKPGCEVVSASPDTDTPERRFSHFALLRLGSIDLMLNTAYRMWGAAANAGFRAGGGAQ